MRRSELRCIRKPFGNSPDGATAFELLTRDDYWCAFAEIAELLGPLRGQRKIDVQPILGYQRFDSTADAMQVRKRKSCEPRRFLLT